MVTTEDKWLSFFGQGIRHLVVDGRFFACGREKGDAAWARNNFWELDDEGPACQTCVRAQMKATQV